MFIFRQEISIIMNMLKKAKLLWQRYLCVIVVLLIHHSNTYVLNFLVQHNEEIFESTERFFQSYFLFSD